MYADNTGELRCDEFVNGSHRSLVGSVLAQSSGQASPAERKYERNIPSVPFSQQISAKISQKICRSESTFNCRFQYS